MKKILEFIGFVYLVLVLTSCGSTNNKKSTIYDSSDLKFVSKAIQYVQDGEKDVMRLQVEGCIDNLDFKITGGDWKDFDIDRSLGEISFKNKPNFKIKKEYKFTAIAESCIDEIVKLDIVVNILSGEETSPVAIDQPMSIEGNSSLQNSDSVVTDDENDYFITKWKTYNEGSTEGNQIEILTKEAKYYNFNIDWGDGSINQGVTSSIIHTYENIGIYTVKISGDFPRMVPYRSYERSTSTIIGDHLKLISIEQWGKIKWESMDRAFFGCANLRGNFIDNPDLSKVSDMSNMFFNAKVFNSDIGSWDVSTITHMGNMFESAENFNQDIGLWDVSNVVDMGAMFNTAKSFNQDINSWDVSNVTMMVSMFNGASSFNKPLDSWDVSNVQHMSYIFNQARSFNQNISSWDVSNVEQMLFAFANAEQFNQNLSSWDLSSVTYISYMFNGASSFSNHDLSVWNVSNVTEYTNFSSGWGIGNTEPNWQN